MERVSVESLLCGISSCECGRNHNGILSDCVICEGALASLVPLLQKHGAKYPYVLCDKNTYKAAGERVVEILRAEDIPYVLHVIERDRPSPDEVTVDEVAEHFHKSCDSVIAVGGGVINDTGKLISAQRGVVDVYVSTAPSMDGFASATSSMEVGGLKVSLPTKCPDAVIADTDVLASAPVHMIRSGIGDMLAKYVSIAEWRLANIITGEYYCDRVADIVSTSLEMCVKSAKSAVERDKAAIATLTEGLVISGMAMNLAGVSRPASGMEHYVSHMIDMRALEFGRPSELHGIQCGIATLTTLKAYDKLSRVTPSREAALSYVRDFEAEAWNDHLKASLGRAADAIIEGERREGKYDVSRHGDRLCMILERWNDIIDVIRTLPSAYEVEAFMRDIGHPTSYSDIGITQDEYRDAFVMAKDVRDKYVLGRLLWDLGIIDEVAAQIE